MISAPVIGLIDYGSGNHASVLLALRRVAANVREVRSAAEFDAVTHLVLPGVGAFARAMRQLETLELLEGLQRHVLRLGKPFLGICVGMQILATRGHEFGESQGLDFVPGDVRPLAAASAGLRLPHIGWNELTVTRRAPLFAGLPDRPCFYFVHSYQLADARPEQVTATCRYGGAVTAAVQRDNICGVQFHPEKSQSDGLRLLHNFCSWQP